MRGQPIFCVRSAWVLSNGCKSRVSPNSENYNDTSFFIPMKDFNRVVLLRSKWAFTSFEVSTLTDWSKHSLRSKWDDFIGVVQGRRIKYFTLLLKNAARNYSAVTKWHLPFWNVIRRQKEVWTLKRLKVWWDENCVNRIFMNDFIRCDIIL